MTDVAHTAPAPGDDAVQGDRWARFVWVRGQCLGGFTGGGQAVGWELVHSGLPRARVSLGECAPPVGAGAPHF